MRVQLAASFSLSHCLSLSLFSLLTLFPTLPLSLSSFYLFVRLLQNIVEYYFLFILPLTLIFISVSASPRIFSQHSPHSLFSLSHSFAAVAALLITSLVAYVIQVPPTGQGIVVGVALCCDFCRALCLSVCVLVCVCVFA